MTIQQSNELRGVVGATMAAAGVARPGGSLPASG